MKFMTVKEFSRAAGISRQAVYLRIKHKSLKVRMLRTKPVAMIPMSELVKAKRLKIGRPRKKEPTPDYRVYKS